MSSPAYQSIIVNLSKPAPALGYYGYRRLKDQLEELLSKGEISENEYNYAIKMADYQLEYFYPKHEDAIYIVSISLWRWSSTCTYLGSQQIPQWLVAYIRNSWQVDTEYPEKGFPEFLYYKLADFVKEMPPKKCFDFSIVYAMGFDPRKTETRTAHEEVSHQQEQQEQPKTEIRISEVKIPPEIQDKIDQISEELKETREKTQTNLKSLDEKINHLLEKLEKSLTQQQPAPPPPPPTRETQQEKPPPPQQESRFDEDTVQQFELLPSELNLLNRLNGKRGKWHEIRQIGKSGKKVQVLVLKSPDETYGDFKAFIETFNNELANLQGRRQAVQRTSPYELREYSSDRKGWNDYAESVLRRLPKDCPLYRLANEDKRKHIENLVKYALNTYLEDMMFEAENTYQVIQWDKTDPSFFPVSEICQIIQEVDSSNRKDKQATKLERISEMIKEWEGTDEGRAFMEYQG